MTTLMIIIILEQDHVRSKKKKQKKTLACKHINIEDLHVLSPPPQPRKLILKCNEEHCILPRGKCFCPRILFKMGRNVTVIGCIVEL